MERSRPLVWLESCWAMTLSSRKRNEDGTLQKTITGVVAMDTLTTGPLQISLEMDVMDSG